MSENYELLKKRLDNASFVKGTDDLFTDLIVKFLSSLNKLQVTEIISCCNKRIEEIKIEGIKSNGLAKIKIGQSHPLYNSLHGKVGIVIERSSKSAKIEFDNDMVITIPVEQLIPYEEEIAIDNKSTSDSEGLLLVDSEDGKDGKDSRD